MLYRASEHGFDPADFHKKCDFKGATIVFTKIKGDKIYGGYTDIPWISSKSRRYSRGHGNSFIFALGNNQSFEIM